MNTLTSISLFFLLFTPIFAYFPSYKRNFIKITHLNSLGDPDLSLRWNFLRYFQDFARIYDYWLFSDDPDTPNWTFPSPVVWAPWMETIWFGNYYDYRFVYNIQ